MRRTCSPPCCRRPESDRFRRARRRKQSLHGRLRRVRRAFHRHFPAHPPCTTSSYGGQERAMRRASRNRDCHEQRRNRSPPRKDRRSGHSRSATIAAPACRRPAWSCRTIAASTSTWCCSCSGWRRRSAALAGRSGQAARRQGAAVAGRRDRPDPGAAPDAQERRAAARQGLGRVVSHQDQGDRARVGAVAAGGDVRAGGEPEGRMPATSVAAAARASIAAYESAVGRPFTRLRPSTR